MDQFIKLGNIKYTIVAGDLEAVVKIKKFYGKKDGLYCCNICGVTEKHMSNIRSHVESKHYSPGYPCSICGKVFKLRNSINSHYKTDTHVQKAQEYMRINNLS